MRRGKTFFWIVVVLAAAWVAADFASPFLEIEHYRGSIERSLSQALEGDVRIGGTLALRLFPKPRFEARELSLIRPPGGTPSLRLQVDTLALEIAPWELLRGRVEIEELVLSGGELIIERAHGVEETPRVVDVTSLMDGTPREGLGFDLRRLELDFFQILIQDAKNEASHLVLLRELSILAQELETPVKIHAEGEFRGGRFDLTGNVGSLSELFNPSRPYPLELRGRLFDSEIRATGSVAIPLALSGLDLHVSLSLPDASVLAPHAQSVQIPSLGPLEIDGRLQNPGGVLGIAGLRVVSEGDLLRLGLSGNIGDLLAFRKVDLVLQIETHEAQWLESVLDRNLPALDALSGRVVFSDSAGQLGAKGKLNATAEPGDVRVEVSGEVDDLRMTDEIQLQVSAKGDDLTSFGKFLELETELPSIGPVSFQGKLIKSGKIIGLDGIKLVAGSGKAGSLSVDGRVRDLEGFNGVRLTAEVENGDLDAFAPYLAEPLPDMGRVQGHVLLSDRDGSLGIEEFKLQAGKKDLFEVAVTGSFEDIRKLDEIDADVDLKAKDVRHLGEAFGIHLPSMGSVAFSGHVKGSNELLSVKDILVQVGDTLIRGDLSGDFIEGERPRVYARLATPRLELINFGIGPYADAEQGGVSAEGEAKGGWFDRWLAGEEELQQDVFYWVDLDLVLNAKSIVGRRGLEIPDAKLEVRLMDGDLKFDGLAAGREQGHFNFDAQIDYRTPTPLLEFQVDGKRLDLTQAVSQWTEEAQDAGQVDLSAQLSARGRTFQEIRSSLNGSFSMAHRNSKVIMIFARAFVRNFIEVILPFQKEKELPPSKCFVVRMSIEKGVGEVEDFFLQGGKIILLGEGRIDFGRDAYAMRLKPVVSDPGLLSVVPTVDVSGPLDDPIFTPVPYTFVSSAVRGFASTVLKPGKLLLKQFYKTASAYQDYCPVESSGVGLERDPARASRESGP